MSSIFIKSGQSGDDVQPAPAADQGTIHPPLSRWIIYFLTLIYMINMLDRQIITILVEPMKHDLHLADWQVGAISGLAFALLYTIAGIPLARFADKHDRAKLIAVALVVWSSFTVACGFTRSFGEMLLARIGVGVGEAGCTPAAHSFISDYVPTEKRSSALATYSLGTPLGSLAGLALGGLLLAAFGWRAVFVFAGLPGLALAVIIPSILKDPRHGAAEKARSSARPVAIPLKDVLRTLGRKHAFWCICVASGLSGFCYFGQTAFLGSLYLRTHAVELGAMAASVGMAPTSFLGIVLAGLLGICAAIGTVLGGAIADRVVRKGMVAFVHMPIFTLGGAAPFLAAAVVVSSLPLSFVCLGIGNLFYAMTYGPAYGAIQTMSPPRMRAMASAIQIFAINAIGLAFGPLAVGILSDRLLGPLGPVFGLRGAMAAAVGPVIVAAFLYRRAAKTILKDVQP